MTTKELVWLIVDGEQWEDMDKILGYEVPDDMRKDKIAEALEEKFSSMSDRQLQRWINKYK